MVSGSGGFWGWLPGYNRNLLGGIEAGKDVGAGGAASFCQGAISTLPLSARVLIVVITAASAEHDGLDPS